MYDHPQLKKNEDGTYRPMYRYDFIDHEDGTVSEHCMQYEIVRTTPKGVVVRFSNSEITKERFVNLESTKRLCHETKEKALESFIARKRRYYEILTWRRNRTAVLVNTAQQALRKLQQSNVSGT